MCSPVSVKSPCVEREDLTMIGAQVTPSLLLNSLVDLQGNAEKERSSGDG